MNTHLHIPYNSPLCGYVTGMWEVNDTPHKQETILPQGVVELVFNLSDPLISVLPHADVALHTPDYFIQGFNTHVVQVNYTGRHHLFGIRLQPYIVKPLLGIQSSELKNTVVDLSLIQPRFNNLWQQLNEARSFNARLSVVEQFFASFSITQCDRTAALCNLVLNTTAEDATTVEAIAQTICYSTRQLNRKTNALFGLPAEELVSYKKFRIATQLMHSTQTSLTSVAYDAGFYDQAHFCRIFKNYTGLTPKQYQLNKSGLPFHLFA